MVQLAKWVSLGLFKNYPMTATKSITCKPTPWFLLRAGAMLLMFGTFTALFYVDGSTGYRKKNQVFYLHRSFQMANEEFSKMNADGSLTAAAWQSYAAGRTVAFPEDRAVLPVSTEFPMPWPAVLQDYERMKPLQWNILWREYTKERGLNATPPEQAYDAQKIREQWIVGGVCSALSAAAAFVLLRTLGRSISADDAAITTQQGKRVPYADLKTLDLRKWETKGLAFIDYDGAAGKGRIRIDGLTYGGFKAEDQEPAERLMQQIRSHFTGEIIEYTSVRAVEDKEQDSPSA
jgi:hypothetical protein